MIDEMVEHDLEISRYELELGISSTKVYRKKVLIVQSKFMKIETHTASSSFFLGRARKRSYL